MDAGRIQSHQETPSFKLLCYTKTVSGL